MSNETEAEDMQMSEKIFNACATEAPKAPKAWEDPNLIVCGGGAGPHKDEAQGEGSANAMQVGGDHYHQQAIQPWDYIVANNIPFLEGNVIKYVSRWRDKGGVEDLKKASHYLNKLIEITEKNNG